MRIFLVITVLVISVGCGANAQLYYPGDKDKDYMGRLSDSTFTILKQFLVKTTGVQPKDTLLIKYDYSHESCWDALDRMDKPYIMGFVTRNKERVQTVLSARPNVSIFQFREPGKDFNKMKKWDNSILIDSTRQLFNLLFQKRSTCGNSIIVLPDRRFVFLRSDSHSEILDLTPMQLVGLLGK